MYPYPVFRFRVDMSDVTAEFSEVTGINIETQIIEYRHGLSPDYSMTKMPGIKKFGNITMKRGVFKGNNEFFAFYQQIQMNQVERKDIRITLLDENEEPVMEWEVFRAWPTKITSPDMKANGNEVAIETMELACEGIRIVA